MFGAPTGQRPLPDVLSELFAKAGMRLLVPPSLSSLCCGMLFSSRGFKQQADAKSAELASVLQAVRASLPTPCMYWICFLSFDFVLHPASCLSIS